MPIILPDLPQQIADRIIKHIANPKEFWPAPYPVPSVALDESSFSPDSLVDGKRRIWRGPLSMNTNWFIARALKERGYNQLGEYIAHKSRELVERYGFNEFYNSITGSPVGVDDFGWATLVVDM